MKYTCYACGHVHQVNPASLMGQAKSKAKAESSRQNGKKGGRPKKANSAAEKQLK